MDTDGRVRKNFSIDRRVDEILNEFADEWETSRSQIVNDAVVEYVDRDRAARIEEKLDQVLDRLDENGNGDGDDRENVPKKERFEQATASGAATPASASNSGSKLKQRPDAIYETLMDLYGSADVIDRTQIVDAIETWWGSASDHMVSKYLPKVSDRLQDDGWYYIEDPGYWCRTTEARNQMFTVVWRKGSAEAADPSDLDSVREWRGALDTNLQSLIDHDIAEPEEIRSTRSKLQTHERRIERRQ